MWCSSSLYLPEWSSTSLQDKIFFRIICHFGHQPNFWLHWRRGMRRQVRRQVRECSPFYTCGCYLLSTYKFKYLYTHLKSNIFHIVFVKYIIFKLFSSRIINISRLIAEKKNAITIKLHMDSKEITLEQKSQNVRFREI